MLLIQDIDIFSSCEHHILPIIGRAHVAYIPNGKVKGAISGHIQKVKELFYDYNGDPLLLKIEQFGDIACHTGARSCFFTAVQIYPKF